MDLVSRRSIKPSLWKLYRGGTDRPKRNKELLLEDIRSALVRIDRYQSGLTREQFLTDEKTSDAIASNLEIIGEAVRWLPDAFKQAHQTIPWAQIAGLRNRIVHD